jgi:UDP-N-acetylmuramoyl-tripeptide--D-alanyl-D-alanine ligase
MITLQEVIQATGGKLLSGQAISFSGVSTDTRTIEKTELFFALKGERFDANDFLTEALAKGAGVATNRSDFKADSTGCAIYVRDTLQALQDLAAYVRKRQALPITAITGSNGKTTTKEMIASILGEKYRVLKNKGNLNNHIGAPLTILKLSEEHEHVVLEFGMSGVGEIRRLGEIASPNCGVITNIGPAHIGILGSLEAICDAKCELLESVESAVVNADDELLMNRVKRYPGSVVTFSLDREADVRVRRGDDSLWLSIQGRSPMPFKLNAPQRFNCYNAAAAAAACYSYGFDGATIVRGLENYQGVAMRFEMTQKDGVTIINDAYNANPASMASAIDELARFKGQGRLVAMLGDMLELGGFSEEAHQAIVKKLSILGVDILVAVGTMMSLASKTAQGVTVHTFSNAIEAGRYAGGILQSGDTLLVKGSRGLKMELALKEALNAL